MVFLMAPAFVAPFMPHSDPHAVSVRRTRLGAWTLVQTIDPFLKATNCELYSDDVLYENGVVVFQFPRHTQTYDAVYSLNGTAPVSWRINALELARKGASFSSDDVENPSGGQVSIPFSVLSKSVTITVRPNATGKSHTLRLAPLLGARAKALLMGCYQSFDGSTP